MCRITSFLIRPPLLYSECGNESPRLHSMSGNHHSRLAFSAESLRPKGLCFVFVCVCIKTKESVQASMKVKNGVLGDVTPALADQIPSGGSANYVSSLSGSRQRNVVFPNSSLSPSLSNWVGVGRLCLRSGEMKQKSMSEQPADRKNNEPSCPT
jgi:hypothetical protein